MTINNICNILKNELFNNNYEYGFVIDNKRYTPTMDCGFDYEYYNLTMTIYRVQNPLLTIKEKIGTCIDACFVMKYILNKYEIDSKIWLLHEKIKNKVHTILTFEAENKIVYLELTPQSNKPNYGKEIIFDNIEQLVTMFQNDGIDIIDVTDQLTIGEQPLVLINKII